jgi:2-dehydro-3-deoxyphosphooctonate aldolase (KDO 8-P synthase)
MITKGSFTFIMGPCLIEDHRHAMEHAHFLRGLADEYHVKIIYKSSFLKDNRTEAGGVKHITKRPTDGLEILRDVRKILPVVTDIHLANDAGVTPIFTWTSEGYINRVQSADMIQIPAMLSRQTSLLESAGRTKFPILIKKGQWMDAKEFYAAARKVAGAGGIPILCERGNMSGGRYLYVDMELLSELIASPYPAGSSLESDLK